MKINTLINNSIRSLFQMIVLVDDTSGQYEILDHDREPDEFSAKLEKAIEAYNKSHSNPYTVGCSYGWVVLPVKEGMTDLDEYIDLADQKMYEMRVIRDKHRRK